MLSPNAKIMTAAGQIRFEEGSAGWYRRRGHESGVRLRHCETLLLFNVWSVARYLRRDHSIRSVS